MSADAVELEVTRLLEAGQASAAAARLIAGHGPAVLGYLRASLRDPDTADDAFAQCCEDVWRGLGSFRGEASLRSWFYRVAWHAAVRQLRDPHRRRRQPLDSGQLEELVARTRSATPLHRKSEARDRLAELRAAMDPEEQTLLTLRLDRGLSWSEVAHVLSVDAPVSEATARKRFERLCARLRRLAATPR